MSEGAGKGDSYRPVDQKKWRDNWDRIFNSPNSIDARFPYVSNTPHVMCGGHVQFNDCSDDYKIQRFHCTKCGAEWTIERTNDSTPSTSDYTLGQSS